MNISQYKQALKILKKAGNPCMVWGPGGIGKSEGAEQVAKELDINFLCIEAPVRDPVDLCGYPMEKEGRMVWARPEILPEEGEGILLIDELPDAAQMFMKALYHLILKNEIAGHKIPKSWYIVGAGNRAEDKGMSSPMPAPLITRLSHIGVYCDAPDFTDHTVKEAQVDIDDWINWALDNLHSLVVSYIKFASQNLYHYQATPRTWEYVSRLLTTENDWYSFVFKELVRGTVGAGVGNEFISFLELATKLPDIDSLIANPEKAPLPTKSQILYAVTTTLILRLNAKNENNILTYITRIEKEYQFYFMKAAAQKYNKIISNKKYIEWVNNNKDFLVG